MDDANRNIGMAAMHAAIFLLHSFPSLLWVSFGEEKKYVRAVGQHGYDAASHLSAQQHNHLTSLSASSLPPLVEAAN